MGLTLWIDKNELLGPFLEKIFKKQNRGFYLCPNARDFAYLVEDLRPSLIVLDRETGLLDLEVLKAQYEGSSTMRDTAFVVIGEWEGLEFIQNKLGRLPRKLDPFEVPKLVEELVKIKN